MPPVKETAPLAETGLRSELADRIAELDATRTYLEQTLGAVRLAEKMVMDADGKKVRVTGEIESARAALTGRIVDAAHRGVPLDPDTTLRNARIAEADAEDEVTAARAALEQVSQPLDDIRYTIEQREKRVKLAAENVLAAELPGIVDAIHEGLAGLLKLAVAADFIASHDPARNLDDTRRSAARRARALAENILVTARHSAVSAGDATEKPLLMPWNEALAALATDPNASLPV